MELEAKESDLAGERKATELAEHKLSESRDQVQETIKILEVIAGSYCL